MKRPKFYRVLFQEKRIYAVDLTAHSESDAKTNARHIYLNQGFASGQMVELLDLASLEILGASEKTNESTTHGNR